MPTLPNLLQQPALPFVSVRPVRADLCAVPALAVTGASATLTGNVKGLTTVAQVLMLLTDSYQALTDYDVELLNHLYELVRDA